MPKIMNAVFAVGMIVALLAAAGLGAWAYQLDQQLMKTKADLSALTTESAKTKSALTTSQSDLDAAKKSGDSLQTQLKTAQVDNDKLRAKMDSIQKQTALLYAFQFSNVSVFQDKVSTSGDQKLQALWATANRKRSLDAYVAVANYLIESLSFTVNN